jgi:flagellar motility protein MotE (MotC chaperone)
MKVVRMGMHRVFLLALALWALIGPARAQQGWQPLITQPDGAPTEQSRSGLEGGWFPVVINPMGKAGKTGAPPPIPTRKVVTGSTTTGTASQQTIRESADGQSSRSEIQRSEISAPPKPEAPQKEAPPKGSLAESYCANIADAAADARFAWQLRQLRELDAELQRRIEILEKRTAEYREWLARRDAFVEKAQESLVRIFSRMRPDAAASQLAAMDEETAAAVLTKLEPRNASAILNEMPPGPAARLTMTIAGAARVPSEEEPAPAAGGGRS